MPGCLDFGQQDDRSLRPDSLNATRAAAQHTNVTVAAAQHARAYGKPAGPSAASTGPSPSGGSQTPLIFLDIDGVICCNHHGELEEAKLANLRIMAEATGAKVVLSSDWRRQRPLKQRVQRALARIGVGYVGCTSQRKKVEVRGSWLIEQPVRPLEIVEWLQRHRDGGAGCPWVAIDDRGNPVGRFER